MRWRSVLKALPTVVLVVDILIRVVAVVAVPRNRRPSSAMAWLLPIFVSPIPGSLLFGLIGSRELPQRPPREAARDQRPHPRRGRPRPTCATVRDRPALVRHRRPAEPHPRGDAPHPGQHRNPAAGLRSSIAGHDRRRRRGRAVRPRRVLHPHAATRRPSRSSTPWSAPTSAASPCGCSTTTGRRCATRRAASRATGCATRASRSRRCCRSAPRQGTWRRPDLRNHRKIVVVDGDVAFTGSQNMTDPSYNKRGNIRRGLQWKDLMVRLEGPAADRPQRPLRHRLVQRDRRPAGDDRRPAQTAPRQARRIDCQVVPSGPGFDGENNLRLFNALVYGAQERLIIASPYFVPDDSMLYAITTAAERGVEVQLFACEVADQFVVYHAQRSYYETLLRAGVRIFLYEKPDRAALEALHGRRRRRRRRLEQHGHALVQPQLRGVAAWCAAPTSSTRLRAIEDDYRAESREITLERWLARPAGLQVLDNVARLTAPVQ